MAMATRSTSTILFPFGISLTDLDVLDFSGAEGISQLTRFELHLVSEHADIDFDDVVNKRATLTMEGGEGKTRYFHGIISRFAQGDASPHHVEYYAQLVPKCWLLTMCRQSRIFQQIDVQEIVERVLGDAGLSSGTDFKFNLENSYSKREYCVQYRESDFNFISRLLEEEGIFYFFESDENDTTLVMGDHTGAHPDCAPDNEALCHERAGQLDVGDQYVFESRYEQRVCSGKVTLNDFNFTSPTAPMLVASQGDWDGALEVYDHPGEYEFRDAGEKLARVRLQELDSLRRVLTGRSNFYSFTPGHKVRLKAGIDSRANTLLNCRDDLNDKMYLVTSVTHRGEQRAILARDEPGAGAKYENEFECILFDTPFRPARITSRPSVRGSQTAIVVGPSGEEIYTDDYGRVKVQFHWDREGKSDDKSSCWIRVASGFAGSTYGNIFIPRIGQEVIVDFLEGDPDQPIITGRVYNAENMPPYKLPDEKTKSTMKTNSSKGGGGFNEIRFEDKKGDEEIFVHAQKDRNIVVENNETHSVLNDREKSVSNNEDTTIGKNRTEKVGEDEKIEIGANRTESVGKNESINIGKDRTESVGKDESINIGENRLENVGKDEAISIGGKRETSIGKDETVAVGGNRAYDVGKNDTLKVGKKMLISVGDQITIQTGKAKIVMKKDGKITIEGKDINIKGSGKINIKASSDIKMKGSKISEN